ncbi:MAG: GNAT family N-acetyltransferase [Planctomycetales bacterium]|nr:GNAT family N-acetyltransferase [Planctomycetales bacterium]
MEKLSIRKIIQSDNSAVSQIIRQVMTEFGAVGTGFSIQDPEVDCMFESHQSPVASFYVLESKQALLGCGGISPLVGGDETTCELKKMYFLPQARGRGAGRVLAELLVNDARRLGFQRVYIETLESMIAANQLYRKLGFRLLPSKLGNTGHCGCDTFYELPLQPHEEITIL